MVVVIQPQDQERTWNGCGRHHQHGHVNAMPEPQETPDNSVINGTITIFGTYARILVDYGAFHSFIPYRFSKSLDLKLSLLLHPLRVSTPISGDVALWDACRAFLIRVADMILYLTSFCWI